jgi:TolB protein
MKKLLVLIALFSFSVLANAQNSVGVFENHADVGTVLLKGSATYDNATKTYTLSGSGENIWFRKDALHFAYKTMKDNFLVSTQPSLVGRGVDPHRKSGWMARVDADSSSAMVCLTVHGDGLTAFQYRKLKGGNIEEIKIPMLKADVLQLERRGRSYIVSVAKLGQPFWSVEVPDFDFPAELLVGLFVCAHNKNVLEKGTFQNTRIFAEVK